MKVHWDSRVLQGVVFRIYIKLNYQQNSVSTVIVNLENFARLAYSGENNKKKIFGSRLQNTDFVNF